jgi:hypothetical protein
MPEGSVHQMSRDFRRNLADQTVFTPRTLNAVTGIASTSSSNGL